MVQAADGERSRAWGEGGGDEGCGLSRHWSRPEGAADTHSVCASSASSAVQMTSEWISRLWLCHTVERCRGGMKARSAGGMGLGMGLLGEECFRCANWGWPSQRDRQAGAGAGKSSGSSSAEAQPEREADRQRQAEAGRGRHCTLGPNGGLSRMRWTRGCGGCVRKQARLSLGLAWRAGGVRACGVELVVGPWSSLRAPTFTSAGGGSGPVGVCA
jgi:hypothetical protein